MATTIKIALDEALIAEAMQLTGATFVHDVIDTALRELVRRMKRRDIAELVGKVKFHEGFDPKDGFA
jgi:Arc/MetJ family transcription regulator